LDPEKKTNSRESQLEKPENAVAVDRLLMIIYTGT